MDQLIELIRQAHAADELTIRLLKMALLNEVRATGVECPPELIKKTG